MERQSQGYTTIILLTARLLTCASAAVGLLATAGCASPQSDANTTQPAGSSALAPYAGTYRLGDGFTGSILTIDVNGSGAFSQYRDVGGKSQWSLKAHLADGMLVVVISAMVRGEDGMPRDAELHYIPVRWGERLYLLQDDEGPDFRAAIERGLEPRKEPFGSFYLREDDWTRPAPGRPADVPAEAPPGR